MGSCFVRTFETHPKHDRVSSDSKLCCMRKGSWRGYPSGFATRILCVANMSNTMFFTFCKHAFWISLGPKLSSLKTCKTMNFCTMFQLLRHVQMRQGHLTQRETMKRCLSYQSTPYCRMTLHTCNTLDYFGGERRWIVFQLRILHYLYMLLRMWREQGDCSDGNNSLQQTHAVCAPGSRAQQSRKTIARTIHQEHQGKSSQSSIYIYIENGSKVINTNLNSQEVQHLKCSLIVAIIQQQ